MTDINIENRYCVTLHSGFCSKSAPPSRHSMQSVLKSQPKLKIGTVRKFCPSYFQTQPGSPVWKSRKNSAKACVSRNRNTKRPTDWQNARVGHRVADGRQGTLGHALHHRRTAGRSKGTRHWAFAIGLRKQTVWGSAALTPDPTSRCVERLILGNEPTGNSIVDELLRLNHTTEIVVEVFGRNESTQRVFFAKRTL